MAFAQGGPGRVRSDINITPLVDVVLVLLIIFMVMTPSLLKEMDVTVPDKADVQMAVPTTSQVVLSISREGRIAVDHEPIPESELTARIHDLMSGRAEKVVFFDVDDDANYGETMHVMDVCRGAGVKTLGIVTR